MNVTTGNRCVYPEEEVNGRQNSMRTAVASNNSTQWSKTYKGRLCRKIYKLARLEFAKTYLIWDAE